MRWGWRFKGVKQWLRRQARHFEIDDLEHAVGVFGAHDGDDDAGHEEVLAQDAAFHLEAAGLVFEHDFVVAGGDVGVALAGGWRGDLVVGGDVGEDVGFERHVEVDGAGDPAEGALADVEDAGEVDDGFVDDL